MSRWLRWLNNGKQGIKLLNAIQRSCMERLASYAGQLRKERNQSNQYEQSSQSSESNIVTADSCTPATCTCARTSSRNGYRIPCKCASGSTTSRGTAHTSFPCAHCRDHVSITASVVLNKHGSQRAIIGGVKYSNASDASERDYTEYIASSGAAREDTGARIWASNEPRNFKQADASSGDSIERRIGIPAGVTI